MKGIRKLKTWVGLELISYATVKKPHISGRQLLPDLDLYQPFFAYWGNQFTHIVTEPDLAGIIGTHPNRIYKTSLFFAKNCKTGFHLNFPPKYIFQPLNAAQHPSHA